MECFTVEDAMTQTTRQLHQMTGDHLQQLRRPLCSEFSVSVKGSLNARREEHRKKVSLLFKDRNFIISKVNRSQHEVYGTLLKVHKQKKLMQREKLKRMHEEAREIVNAEKNKRNAIPVQDVSKVDRLVLSKFDTGIESKPTKENNESVHITNKDNSCGEDKGSTVQSDTPSVEHGKGDISNYRAKASSLVPKAKALEVQKDTLAPIVRERSSADIKDSTLDGQKPVVERTSSFHPFPKISEKLEPSVGHNKTHDDESSESTSRKKKKSLSDVHRKRSPSKAKLPPPDTYLKSQETGRGSGLVGISEEKYKSTVNSTPSDKLAASWSHPEKQDVLSRGSRARETGGSISLVELNRLRARQQETLRKEILDNEPINQYVMDEKGRVVKDIKDFHRREFNPPSLKEKHFQHKMLLSQTEAKIQQQMKMEDFFGQIEADLEKAEARKRALLRRAADAAAAAEAEEKTRREQETVGVSLAVIAAAFNRIERLPTGVEPDSVEALKWCNYTREYKPFNMTREEKLQAKRWKKSSWST